MKNILQINFTAKLTENLKNIYSWDSKTTTKYQ